MRRFGQPQRRCAARRSIPGLEPVPVAAGGYLAPHPARNARARRRVWRPCPPPGKRRRRLNAPYAGSPSPLQRFVECAYRRRVHLRLRCPSLRRFPANRRLGSSAVTEAPVHHDPRASPRCNGITRRRLHAACGVAGTPRRRAVSRYVCRSLFLIFYSYVASAKVGRGGFDGSILGAAAS